MAYNIMVQGTMSNAGKSLLCAALCRIFRQDGLRAAPVQKPEHGAQLVHHRLRRRDGKGPGRAAEAAGIAPDVRMNPILLKPTTDVGSQVIVNGAGARQHALRWSITGASGSCFPQCWKHTAPSRRNTTCLSSRAREVRRRLTSSRTIL